MKENNYDSEQYDEEHWMSFHVEGWYKPNQMTDKVIEALNFAEKKHKGQLRDDGKTPYFKHILDVIDILIENGHGWERTLLAAALHDTLEDTNTTYRELSDKFGEEAAGAVKLLTKEKGELFDEYANRIFSSDDCLYAGSIKLADRLANLRDLPFCGSQTKIEKYLAETKRCILSQKGSPDLKDKIRVEILKIEKKWK